MHRQLPLRSSLHCDQHFSSNRFSRSSRSPILLSSISTSCSLKNSWEQSCIQVKITLSLQTSLPLVKRALSSIFYQSSNRRNSSSSHQCMIRSNSRFVFHLRDLHFLHLDLLLRFDSCFRQVSISLLFVDVVKNLSSSVCLAIELIQLLQELRYLWDDESVVFSFKKWACC